ncbi:hypothetical protein [Rhizobium beringeri]|uniref:hypothetical protein n=1 Tax=Rhizobium beringeri TaxID=3019934 RepID=UPI002E14B101|nr:hypothetical protein U8P69_34680 [Rhizobium beringeri]
MPTVDARSLFLIDTAQSGSLITKIVHKEVLGDGFRREELDDPIVLGDQMVLTRTKQASAKFGESRKTSTAEQRQKLMTADQILELKTGKMLLLAGSKPPVFVEAIVSHRHPTYRGKLDRNPMV